MPEDVTVWFVPDPSGPAESQTSGTTGSRPTSAVPSVDAVHSGLVIETVKDAWIYCKASKKMVAGNRMLPWLSGGAAVISAITGLAVFASLQASPSTPARIAVGAVAVITAVITALQTWTSSRIRSLNNQAHSFHEFHRRMMAELEAGMDLKDPNYAQQRETELQGLVAGINEPSPRLWGDSQERVDEEMRTLFPHIAAQRPPTA